MASGFLWVEGKKEEKREGEKAKLLRSKTKEIGKFKREGRRVQPDFRASPVEARTAGRAHSAFAIMS